MRKRIKLQNDSSDSIAQKLDMCEKGPLRGDEILHHHGQITEEFSDQDPKALDLLLSEEHYELDMAETDREGDEMSGDDHSSGLQGGETELKGQVHIDSGFPGDTTQRHEKLERSEWIENLPDSYPETD